ncbi:YrbL family protein [Histidinibacterium aquaticum]|uniref:PhoP regulatory network protein YrbL n=1 Tax=Histidinibacterium aquaticum TaxID=2613962 RepID=A0A5J5GQB4_9RHOB|nr:YrbL family protein [Histidinibacterium aquaticum]KAA9009754.1 hypothetical protein F3S47_00325 [Histidinibacterium aquaticum]
MIDLTGLEPVARGAVRDIYAHPQDSGLLIKVINLARRQHEAARSRYDRLRKPDFSDVFLQEIDMVYRTGRRASGQAGRLPLVEALGLVMTSSGVGQLCERIDGPDGLAPTLGALMRDGRFDAAALDKLNDFISRLYELRVVVRDLHPENVVWDEREDTFVLVDGFGLWTLVPIHAWLKLASDRQLDHAIREKLVPRSGLKWDGGQRRLSM